MPEGYTETGYAAMVADASRVGAYARALEAVVRPGCSVLDLGTGTGLFALLAARLGARRVYAVEPSDAIETARQIAQSNGLGAIIEFIQGISTEISLPERVDVIVADLRGVLPPYRGVVATLRDARERLLAPGGTLVPRRDALMAAPVAAQALWEQHAGPASILGFDFSLARERAFSRWARGIFSPGQLLGEPKRWGELDYGTVSEPHLEGSLAWTVSRSSTGHGLCVWFEADLAEGVTLSSGPGNDTIYQTALFTWPQAVELEPGDRIEATLRARLAGESYVYTWDTDIERPGRTPLRFRQTDFAAGVSSLRALRRRADSFVPTLGAQGEVAAFVLARMDGRASVGELAQALRARFPERFPRWEDAVSRVGELSDRYSR
jgi:protein arginine N-methyltransferase 1